MERIKEAIVVEGKYDTQRVKAAVDATVVETGGFRVFRDGEKMAYLRQLAHKKGLIILTDSDTAGMVIRNHLLGSIPAEQIKNAYIPPIPGKEKRKAAPSAEGLLGVEGVNAPLIVETLRRAGATFEGEVPKQNTLQLTKADLAAIGLSGSPDSANKRQALLKRLGLPTYLSANRLIEAVNAILTPEQWYDIGDTMQKEG